MGRARKRQGNTLALLKDLFSKISETAEKNLPAGRNEPDPLVLGAQKAEKLFDRFNRRRRQKLNEQVGERALQALTALPILLHTNCEGLPGYMEGSSCPAGITGYEAASSELELVGRLFPKAQVRRTPVLKMAIDLVAVMGSAGSIGFTESSDLDIWICFRLSEHNPLLLELLREKVARIEQWMNAHSGVEIHLFVQPTERIRANDFGKIDIEGCGSALGALLKEEFYRTAIVIAGRPPLWWVLPPGIESESYYELAGKLTSEPGFDPSAYIDLGPVEKVVLGELFGAAIWQIAKGQKSPFKSALKMGYLEKNVCAREDTLPLCEILKEKVLDGKNPDPYRILFDEVLTYYSLRGDLSTQELLAECFYLKTGARFDPDSLDRRLEDETEEILRQYILRWGWGRRKIKKLNDFASWRFEWLKELSNDIDKFFLRSYKRIYDTLAQAGMVQSITDRDLTVIGRTLQISYRSAPNKIPHIHLLAGGMKEPVLSLIEASLPSGDSEWRLYRGMVNPLTEEEYSTNLINSFGDVVELMVWAVFNGIMGEKTRLLCRPIDRRFSSADLESIAQLLLEFTGETHTNSTGVEHLLDDPVPVKMFIVANLGREDPEIVEVSALYKTNWGETFYKRHTGTAAFRQFVEGYLFNFWAEAPDPSRITVYAPRRKVSALTSPASRLQKTMARMTMLFTEPVSRERFSKRQILSTVEGLTVIERDPLSFSMRSFESMGGLMRFLTSVGPNDLITTKIEDESEKLSELGLVYNTAENGRIDIFVVERPKIPEIYIVDEIGNLRHIYCDDVNPAYTLAKTLIFLNFAVGEVRTSNKNPLSSVPFSDAIRIHKLSVEPSLRVYPATNDFLAKVHDLGLKPVGLTIERAQGQSSGRPGYRITWGNEVIRSGEVPHPLEELKRRITESRSSDREYGVYVTKLFLDDQFLKKTCGGFVTTGHYLLYKALVEQRLNSSSEP